MNITHVFDRSRVVLDSRNWMMWDEDTQRMLEVSESIHESGFGEAYRVFYEYSIWSDFGEGFEGFDHSRYAVEHFGFRLVWEMGQEPEHFIVSAVKRSSEHFIVSTLNRVDEN